jgi:hypothetical protein
VAATLTPEDASQHTCNIEDPNCDLAKETVTVQLTPKGIADWLLVVDRRPAALSVNGVPSSTQVFSATQVIHKTATQKNTTPTVPAIGLNQLVWAYPRNDSNSVTLSITYQGLTIATRSANHLIIEMPDLLNEFDPATTCGPQVGFVSQPPSKTSLIPLYLGNAYCPSGPTALPSSVSPGNPLPYYAPNAATTVEVLGDNEQFKGYSLDSSDEATPISEGGGPSAVPNAYDWSGNYQLQPTVYASLIQGTGRVLFFQLFLGVLLGAVAAGLFAVIQSLLGK